MPTLTFNPNAHPETTTVDGWASRQSVDEAFSTIRGGAGTLANDSDASATITLLQASATTNQYDVLRRAFFLFDITSLPAGATISSVVFSVYVTSVTNTFSGGASVSLVDTTPASNTAIGTGDYVNTGTTLQATAITLASLSTSAYNDITLNATGLTTVNTAYTGSKIVKLGLRIENDRANSAPTWGSGNKAQINGEMAESANPPKLTITYTAGAGGAFAYFM